jgi:hypothetical protein
LPGKWAQIHVDGVAKVGAVEKMEGGPPSPQPSPPGRGRRSRRPCSFQSCGLRFSPGTPRRTRNSLRQPSLWSCSAPAGGSLSLGERAGVRAGVINSPSPILGPRSASTR